MYTALASLARYGHVEVSLDDPKYAAAVSQLDADDRQRAAAAFTLQDIRGRTWDSKNLAAIIRRPAESAREQLFMWSDHYASHFRWRISFHKG
jgi:hypothetical protein